MNSSYSNSPPAKQDDGKCKQVDHHTQVFTIELRSLTPVQEAAVKALLQQAWEVTKCDVASRSVHFRK